MKPNTGTGETWQTNTAAATPPHRDHRQANKPTTRNGTLIFAIPPPPKKHLICLCMYVAFSKCARQRRGIIYNIYPPNQHPKAQRIVLLCKWLRKRDDHIILATHKFFLRSLRRCSRKRTLSRRARIPGGWKKAAGMRTKPEKAAQHLYTDDAECAGCKIYFGKPPDFLLLLFVRLDSVVGSGSVWSNGRWWFSGDTLTEEYTPEPCVRVVV